MNRFSTGEKSVPHTDKNRIKFVLIWPTLMFSVIIKLIGILEIKCEDSK